MGGGGDFLCHTRSSAALKNRIESKTIIPVELSICPLGGTFGRYLWTKFVENYV